MHVQSCCFANRTYCFFCRSRCRRRRRCLSSHYKQQQPPSGTSRLHIEHHVGVVGREGLLLLGPVYIEVGDAR